MTKQVEALPEIERRSREDDLIGMETTTKATREIDHGTVINSNVLTSGADPSHFGAPYIDKERLRVVVEDQRGHLKA